VGAGDRAGDRGKAFVLFTLMFVSVVGQDDLVDDPLPFPDQPGARFEPMPGFAVNPALWTLEAVTSRSRAVIPASSPP